MEEVLSRVGRDAIVPGWQCTGYEQDEKSVTLHFRDTQTGSPLPSVQAPVAIAADGVNSLNRVQMHPNEAIPRYEGTTQYRGATRWKPFLNRKTMFYMGTFELGKLIMYPIRDHIDDENRQLINWVVEISRTADQLLRDWNWESTADEFVSSFESCKFDWLDIPAVMRAADKIYEYPMIDQEPLPFWTQGRLTLLGDAAHPMMPRGSNGAAQAILDADCISQLLAQSSDLPSALKTYEKMRLKATSEIVLANRSIAPDAILRVVEERSGGKPFDKDRGCYLIRGA